MRHRTAAALATATLLAASACASAAEAPQRVHPYRVLLLPVEGAPAALAEAPGENGIPVAATPGAVCDRVRDEIVAARVFSDLIPLGAAEAGTADAMVGAAAAARKADADLILRVQVVSARLTDLGNNSSTFWSSFTWFMLPAPTWFVDDRSYDTALAFRAELFTPDDLRKPTASIVVSSGLQTLDLWDRGLSPWVPVVPPPFLAGSESSVSEELTERSLRQACGALVEDLRRHEIPSRFLLDVAIEGGSVRVAASSRRKLRALEIRADDRILASWAESELVPDEGSDREQFVYRRIAPLRSGGVVRVVADDEVGGREVRTLRPEPRKEAAR